MRLVSCSQISSDSLTEVPREVPRRTHPIRDLPPSMSAAGNSSARSPDERTGGWRPRTAAGAHRPDDALRACQPGERHKIVIPRFGVRPRSGRLVAAPAPSPLRARPSRRACATANRHRAGPTRPQWLAKREQDRLRTAMIAARPIRLSEARCRFCGNALVSPSALAAGSARNRKHVVRVDRTQ
jgi:hypothetical protein